MKHVVSVTAAAIIAAVLAAGASAAPLGQHAAMCAHEIAPRSGASVTCTHDGVTMTFANFGAMVQQMRSMH